MKNKSFLFYVLTAVFFFCNSVAFSQKNKDKSLDSTLEANSEKWKVKEHKRIGATAKPEFGFYTTLVAEKLDSPVIKKKTKDSSGASIGYSDAGWDISKNVTVEKKKFYRMVLGRQEDTTEIQFYIHTVSAEKRQTVLGKILSNNNEGKDGILKYQKNIEGFIFNFSGSTRSRFFMDDYVSATQTTSDNPGQGNPITGGYILTKTDSLFTEPVIESFGNSKSQFFMQWQKGIYMKDMKGTHVALLQFGGGQPFYIWIRRDLDAYSQDAIAAFFAVIIGVKDL
ncbi:MAG: hypothetical protein ABI184_07480 [Ginsengibacter sp.]